MDQKPELKNTLARNIERLAERQRRDAAAAPWSERIAARITAFTGSMTFVLIHLVLFGGWIGWNLWATPKFDPSFVALAMVASVEAIFLSTFVLISQNRMAALAQTRADLDLHINLLAEHELSRLAALVGEIARRLDVEPPTELAEIERDVEPETVLDTLDEVTPSQP